ncbi:MAG TPA: hypothetical protein PLH57_08550, partial [Oligoflexia bacterium]|nr:hypothetical protein [Oligoflexia bacterium]
MKTIVKELSEIMTDGFKIPAPWRARVLVNDDNMTYLVWNENTREGLFVDPVAGDLDLQLSEAAKIPNTRWIAVIDTHTHADHISNAGELAAKLTAPLIMHANAPTKLVHLRVSRDGLLPTAGGPLRFLVTPGHTHDSITPIWGPFIFGGDTLLYGETGRD